MDPIRILLADDHTLFRQGIRTLLERMPGVEVVGDAASGEDAVAQVAELVPDVVLMDIAMPRLGGVEATARIKRGPRPPKVLILSMVDDLPVVRRALAGLTAIAQVCSTAAP